MIQKKWLCSAKQRGEKCFARSFAADSAGRKRIMMSSEMINSAAECKNT
jgi:hypothetical protein